MSEQSSKVSTDVGKQQLWASRFKKGTDSVAKSYSDSTEIDRHMFYHDIWGSEAHTIMLGATQIITDDQARNILKSLQNVKKQFTDKTWDLRIQEEDVHMNVERFVIDDVGIENGGRMHTARSRNDQVVVDTKLYARDQLRRVRETLSQFITVLLDESKKHVNTICPGYTHTQHAQPMTCA